LIFRARNRLEEAIEGTTDDDDEKSKNKKEKQPSPTYEVSS